MCDARHMFILSRPFVVLANQLQITMRIVNSSILLSELNPMLLQVGGIVEERIQTKGLDIQIG